MCPWFCNTTWLLLPEPVLHTFVKTAKCLFGASAPSCSLLGLLFPQPTLPFMQARSWPELSRPRQIPLMGCFAIIFLLLSHPPQSKFQAFWEQLFVCLSVFPFWTVRSVKTGAASLLYLHCPSWYLEGSSCFVSTKLVTGWVVNGWMLSMATLAYQDCRELETTTINNYYYNVFIWKYCYRKLYGFQSCWCVCLHVCPSIYIWETNLLFIYSMNKCLLSTYYMPGLF